MLCRSDDTPIGSIRPEKREPYSVKRHAKTGKIIRELPIQQTSRPKQASPPKTSATLQLPVAKTSPSTTAQPLETAQSVVGSIVLNMTTNNVRQVNIEELSTVRQQQLHVLGKQAPQAISFVGANRLQESVIVGLICSAKAPASILLAVHDLAQQWRAGSQTIISGFHSTVEQEAFEILLRGPGQIIYCPPRSIPSRLKPAWQAAMTAGYLSLISPFPDTVRRGTKELAVFRNRFVATLADKVLIPYAHPGSSSEQLAHEVKQWGKSVFTLAHPANQHLIDAGILTW
jgi:hypothetical protein